MNIIIPKNTIFTLKTYKTYEFKINDQNNIIIKIYEGEKRIIKENILIGIIEISNVVPDQERTFRIIVNFS